MRVWKLFVGAAIVALALTYVFLNIRLFDQVSLNYNEGWNAYKAQAVLTWQPLYPTWDQPWVNNYPPLSFYLVAALSLLTHDVIIAGRILCLVGILATGFNVGALSAALTQNRRAGLVAALFFFLAVALWFTTFVGLDDPQWLGHGIQTTGALILLARLRERRSLAPVVIGAAVMFLGCLVKHNILVLPLTVWGFLFFVDRKAFLTMSAVFAVLGCAFLAFAAAVYGHPFFEQMLNYQRVIRLNREVHALFASYVLVPALAFAALNGALSDGGWRSRFPSIYVLLACAVGCVELMGEGCDYNQLFDVAIATALTVGSLFDVLPGLLERGGVAQGLSLTLTAVMLFTPVASMLYQLRDPLWYNSRRAVEAPLARSVIATLAEAEGPVACQMLAWCFWADKPMAYDVFNMAERAKKGGDEEARFVNQVANGYFAAIQTQSGAASVEGQTLPFWRALTRNYRRVISDPTDVWVRETPDKRTPPESE